MNLSKMKKPIVCIASILTLLFVFCLYGGYFVCKKIINHERTQDATIKNLSSQILEFKNEINKTKEPVGYLDDGFNYFALGNSITIHGLASYWPVNDRGMAATNTDKDYVHLIANHYKKKEETQFYAFNFFSWEVMSYDRAESLSCLDAYISEKLDLITVQLSENITNIDTYKQDYIDLINYMKEKSPNAKIVMIDDFWDKGKKAQIKKKVAEELNLYYVDLSEIKGKKEYQSSIGIIIDNGKKGGYRIDHSGVASHPGDKGFEYIYKSVMSALGE